MKRVMMAITALALVSAGNTHARQGAAADPLVWCGLDYSMVKMIGTLDFRQPDQIFPEMLTEWNGLFMKEMLP